MGVRVGFTGTASGMTAAQMAEVRSLLHDAVVVELQHGDCVGADAQAHMIAVEADLRIVIRPGMDDHGRSPKRANCSLILHGVAGEMKPPRPYIARNHDIVDSTDVLVAAPRGAETPRGGTWATVRYARKRGRRIAIVQRDGTVVLEGAW